MVCTLAASNGGPAVQLPHRAREAEPEFAPADKVVQGTGLSNLVHLTDLQIGLPGPVRLVRALLGDVSGSGSPVTAPG